MIDSILKTSRKELGENNVFLIRLAQRLEYIGRAVLACSPGDKVRTLLPLVDALDTIAVVSEPP